MLESLTRRNRRSLWGTLSLILIVAAGLGLLFANAQQRGIESDATRLARQTAEVGIAPLLQARDLQAPVTGSRYDALSSDIEKAVLDSGQAQTVTLWGRDGRILFSPDASVVGTKQTSMQDLLFNVANGLATSEVDQGWFKSFVPLWLQPGGTVIVAELARPYAPIVAQANKPWRVSALACAALALASMTLFGLTFRAKTAGATPTALEPAPPPSPKRVPKHEVKIDESSPAYMLPGFRAEAEARREAEARAAALEENFRGLQAQYRAALEQLKALDQRVLAQQSSASQTQGEAELVRKELQRTAERLHQVEIDRDALKERLALAQAELDAAEGRTHDAEVRAERAQRELERTFAELEHLQEEFHVGKTQGALLELDGGPRLEGEGENDEGSPQASSPRLTLRPQVETEEIVRAARRTG